MRKKYLSALYDDDINNLQEQINTIASSLEDLKTKVESMGGVKDVTFADGVLTVTTDAGSATYNIPDKVGITKVELKDGVLYVDGVEAGKAQTVEVKNGILYIDGEAQELNVNFDSNVVATIDKAAGIYTLTVNNETIQLPIAFAEVKISLEDGGYFTEVGIISGTMTPANGIHWARATKDITWDGPKGNIAKDQLVVGQTTVAKVSVRPINYDLKANADKLTLVSSTGETAKAKIVVYESQDEGPLSTDSRIPYTEVKQGDYVLGIELNSDLTDREVIESFATTDGNANVKYALALDGVIVTDYDFVIDTQLKADTQASCDAPVSNKFMIGGKACIEAPTGTHMMSYNDGRIYDMKVTIDPSSEDDAEVYGVKVNGNTITAASTAQNREFQLNVTLIDVNGNISKPQTITVKFAKEEIATVTKLDPTSVVVTPRTDKSFVVNLQDALSSLNPDDAIYIKDAGNIVWGIESADKGFFMNAINTGDVTYYEDAECKKAVDVSDGVTSEKLRKIQYAKIACTDYAASSTLGEHLLTLTIKKYRTIGDTSDKIEIKKINVPVDVKIPAWEDLFAQANNNWDESGVFTTRISNYDVNTGIASIALDAYKVKDDNNGAKKDGIEVAYIGANIDGRTKDVRKDVNAANNVITDAIELNSDASKATADGELKVSDVTANFQYRITNNAGNTVFTIEKKDVKVRIKSMFADLKLVWLDGNGSETSGPAKLNADNTISGTGSAKSSMKNGLAFAFYKQYVEAGDVNNYNTFTVEGIAGGNQKISLDTDLDTPDVQGTVNFKWDASSENGGEVTIGDITPHTGKADGTYDKASSIKLTPKANVLEKGTIKVTFIDAMGVKHTSEVSFEK